MAAGVEAEAAVVRDEQAAVDAEDEKKAALVAAGVEAEAAVVRGEQAAVDAEKETKAALAAARVKEKIVKQKLRKKGNKARKKHDLAKRGRPASWCSKITSLAHSREMLCSKGVSSSQGLKLLPLPSPSLI